MATDQVVASYESLTETEKSQFREQAGLKLAPPTGAVLGVVWIMVIGILGIMAVAGGFLTYRLVDDGKNAEVIVGFVSAALGALIGLIAPSPASASN